MLTNEMKEQMAYFTEKYNLIQTSTGLTINVQGFVFRIKDFSNQENHFLLKIYQKDKKEFYDVMDKLKDEIEHNTKTNNLNTKAFVIWVNQGLLFMIEIMLNIFKNMFHQRGKEEIYKLDLDSFKNISATLIFFTDMLIIIDIAIYCGLQKHIKENNVSELSDQIDLNTINIIGNA